MTKREKDFLLQCRGANRDNYELEKKRVVMYVLVMPWMLVVICLLSHRQRNAAQDRSEIDIRPALKTFDESFGESTVTPGTIAGRFVLSTCKYKKTVWM